ncbi:HAMP domain-containing protein [Desulfallas sp. Bu1-1]|uniref:two-component system histidine kinase PnpS n=1 Tax=Desulfallas sp. Bu1-1 TaxID=2787620 RepID=UPI00189DA68C|nr:ATP-binding protein [Desulfallas sp. Bu1-1]MBF7083170.1 HAMP domain-containing protein [Desulfallas sp. Bu1-1]
MFRRLRWRMTATYIGLVILSMLMLGAFLLHSLEDYFYNNLEARLQTQALLACRLVQEQPDGWNTAFMETLAEQISSDVGARVTIIDAKGVVMGDSEENAAQMENHLNRPEVLQARSRGSGMVIRHSSTLDADMMYVAVPITENGRTTGFMRLALPLTEIKHAFFKLWSAVLIAILLVVLVTAPVSLGLGKKVTEPVERLIDFARQISRGNYHLRARVTSNDEIGELTRTLDEMAQTIKEKVNLITEGKNKLEAVLAGMTSGVIFVNKKGRIDLVNPAAEKFLAFMAGGAADIPHNALIRYPELSEAINEALQNEKVVKQEIKISVPEETILEATISPFRDQDGKLNGVVAVLHDITQIRKLERMRREFVDNVSHELRTPVTAVKGFTETLLDGALDDRETCREFVEIIDREAGRLSRLVQDLLDLSRIESKHVTLKRKPVDMVALIRATAVKFQGQLESAGLKINLHLPASPIFVEVDSDMMEQVLINLVDNAIKYTPPGGLVEMEIAGREQDIVVRVRDTGIGIPPEDLDRVFERFYRVDKARSRARGGTGLGLSIVKHIVDIHGGTVGVNSTPGKGSEFFFTLPKKAAG